MKKPRGIKILGYNYTCVTARDEEYPNSGACDAAKQVIKIAAGLPGSAAQSTVLHEVIEALNYHLQLSLKHSKIMQLEAGLFQALTDNGVSLEPLMRAFKRGGKL